MGRRMGPIGPIPESTPHSSLMIASVQGVTIVGLGLIGGSLGMALRRAGWRVSYADPAVSLEKARAAGAADERVEVPEPRELLVLATPVDAAVTVMSHVRADLLTSTCSVMQPLRAAAHGRNFVAGHPFAGSEQSGLDAASADLFAGRPWFVDRDEPLVRRMIEATGARQIAVAPAEHDAAVALTSHLPQLLSTALASLIERKNIDPVYIGNGLRTLLRLAGSSYEVWGPVLESNDANIRRAIDELEERIDQIDEKDFDHARRFVSR
jgi:prephenate dehydrogenase